MKQTKLFISETAIILDDFISFGLNQLHPTFLSWRTRQELQQDLETSLQDVVQTRMHTPGWVQKYVKHCPVAGATAEDYHLRLIDGGEDGRMLAGIHFYGTDINRPFIGVAGRTQSIPDTAALNRWAKRLQDTFKVFRPLSMSCFQETNPQELCCQSVAGSVGDQRTIAGKVSKILALPPVLAPMEIKLQPLSKMAEYQRFYDAYLEFHREQPTLADKVTPASEEALNNCAQQGCLFDVEVGGQWAGIMAGREDVDGVLSGHLIVEEFLNKDFRGRGLAASTQRLFIGALPDSKGGLIFGTIDNENLASMKTALKNGRTDIGGNYFLPFEMS